MGSTPDAAVALEPSRLGTGPSRLAVVVWTAVAVLFVYLGLAIVVSVNASSWLKQVVACTVYLALVALLPIGVSWRSRVKGNDWPTSIRRGALITIGLHLVALPVGAAILAM